MNLWLTKDEHEVLRECLKIQLEHDADLLKDVHAYSHGDWLNFKFERDQKRKIYKKLRSKDGPRNKNGATKLSAPEKRKAKL